MRHDKNNELLSDAIQIVYVELSKLHEIMKKSVYDMTDLEKWAIFFQYANEPTYRDTVNANQGLKTSVPKAAAMRPKICRSRPVMERIVEAV